MSATVTFASAQIQAACLPRATGRSEYDPERCTGQTGQGARYVSNIPESKTNSVTAVNRVDGLPVVHRYPKRGLASDSREQEKWLTYFIESQAY